VQVKQDQDQSMVTPNTDRSKIGNIEAGNISNENAERRADMSGKPSFPEAQAFDGPAPETINSRLVRTCVAFSRHSNTGCLFWSFCLCTSLHCLGIAQAYSGACMCGSFQSHCCYTFVVLWAC